MIIPTQPPDNPRMGIIYPAEKSTIEEGFLDFVQKLGGKEAMKDVYRVSQIYGYRDWK